MQVHTNLHSLPSFRQAVVTIGTFDGVHTGHRIIIEQLLATAKRLEGEAVIITFHPHPRKIVGREPAEIKLLNTFQEKVRLLQQLGVHHLVVVPFTPEFAQQPAMAYIEDFLVALFKPAAIIIGYDHRFGKNRLGNYQLLEDVKEQFGFSLIEISARVLNNIAISSTRIRNALSTGSIEEANSFLGYPYFFEGVVIEGNKLGRTIGYPTANIGMQNNDKLIPANGVYAVRIKLSENDLHPNWYKGMMNIGFRPTVNGDRLSIEVNIFDFDADIYHQTVEVEMHYFLRTEQKFSGLDALKNQLALDKIKATELLQTF
jgi:riboflavin kinase/FMN adenylyltransferase